jgi:hypothetical protein
MALKHAVNSVSAHTIATATQNSLFVVPFKRRFFSHPWEGSKASRIRMNTIIKYSTALLPPGVRLRQPLKCAGFSNPHLLSLG